MKTLQHRYIRGELNAELRTAMETFSAVLNQHHTLAEGRDHQGAMCDVQQMREQLRSEARHATDCQRALSTLRAELIAKNTLIAQLRTDLTRFQAPQPYAPHVPIIGPRDAGPGPQLSRQQRRAAQRSAHKNKQQPTG